VRNLLLIVDRPPAIIEFSKNGPVRSMPYGLTGDGGWPSWVGEGPRTAKIVNEYTSQNISQLRTIRNL
jgi:hypothetical protein